MPEDQQYNPFSKIQRHVHTGMDSPQVEFGNLSHRRHIVNHTIQGTASTIAANYGVFWISPWPCIITRIKEVHQTAGSDGSPVTLDIEKLTGTQALDSGVGTLRTTLSLKATADTVQDGVLTETIANLRLLSGDRLAMKDSGTLTAVANVTVIVEVQY